MGKDKIVTIKGVKYLVDEEGKHYVYLDKSVLTRVLGEGWDKKGKKGWDKKGRK